MSLNWPSMHFGPINLWNAPSQGLIRKQGESRMPATTLSHDALNAELEGSCKPLSDVADDWDVPEETLLEMLAESGEVEMCTTCGWWCTSDELEVIDDEYTCEDCR